MAINIPRGKTDPIIDKVIEALEDYQKDHPQAEIDLYRQNSVSIRIRVIDEELDGLTKPERSQLIWKYLDKLSEDEQGDLSTIILLTPGETQKSLANFEFEDPIPSEL